MKRGGHEHDSRRRAARIASHSLGLRLADCLALLVLAVALTSSALAINVTFLSPTPANGTAQLDRSVCINLTIDDAAALSEALWSWNGSTVPLYDDSLRLMMDFNRDAGLGEDDTTVADLSRYGNAGNVTDAVYVAGIRGKGMRFDPVGISSVDVPGLNQVFGHDSALTVMLWAKAVSNDQGFGYMLVKGYAFEDQEGDFLLWSNPTADLVGGCIRVDDWYPWYCWEHAQVLDDGWHHYALTNSESGGVQFYFDGALLAQDDGIAVEEDMTNHVGIGQQPGDPWYAGFNGTIDEVRIYNRSLSAAEVAAAADTTGPALRKTASDRWAFSAEMNLSVGSYSFSILVRNASGGFQESEPRVVVIGQPPNTTHFPGTNMSGLADLGHVRNLTLANSLGVLTTGREVFVANQDYDSAVTIGDGYITVNTSALHPTFNGESTITLRGVRCDQSIQTASGVLPSRDAIILAGQRCDAASDPSCTDIQCVPGPSGIGNMSFTVSHFTGFAVGSATELRIWDQTETDGSPYAGFTRYAGDQVVFYANFTNLTGLPANGTDGGCQIDYAAPAYDGYEPMRWNGTLSLFTHNRTFGTSGAIDWRVNCSADVGGVERLAANDTVLISPSMSDIPECGSWALILALCLIVGGIVTLRRR